MSIKYTTLHAVTPATKRAAYAFLVDMIIHLPNLGVDLTSVILNADHTVSVTLTGPIRADHAGFWDLDAGV